MDFRENQIKNTLEVGANKQDPTSLSRNGLDTWVKLAT